MRLTKYSISRQSEGVRSRAAAKNKVGKQAEQVEPAVHRERHQKSPKTLGTARCLRFFNKPAPPKV